MTTTAHTRTDHLAVARAYAADPDEWPLAPRFDPVRRWYHRLARTPDLEVWLLTWLPGQRTDLHDHGGSAGAFVVVSGDLTERVPAAPWPVPDGADPVRLVDTVLPAGAGRRSGARHIHQVANTGTRPAVSLHVYGPALATMTRFRLDGGALRVAARDTSGSQW